MTRNVIVTGGSGGIGLEMAKAMAGAGHAVLLTGRNRDKLEAAIAEVNAAATGPEARGEQLDMGDFAAVRRFAEETIASWPVVDVLLCNAGLYTRKLHTLPNGFEAMIGVMHLGHFLLTHLMLDKLLAGPAPRVVLTSSVAHKRGRIDFASFTDPSRHRLGFSGYAQAKLANLMFARELARRYGDQGLTANAFHPGAVATGIWRELPQPIPWLADRFMITPARGAETGIWLAQSEAAGRVNGEYCMDRRIAKSSAASRDPEMARRLWAESERFCGLG